MATVVVGPDGVGGAALGGRVEGRRPTQERRIRRRVERVVAFDFSTTNRQTWVKGLIHRYLIYLDRAGFSSMYPLLKGADELLIMLLHPNLWLIGEANFYLNWLTCTC